MKMYLPFGDWSHDGHGQYEKILISAPSGMNGKLFYNIFLDDKAGLKEATDRLENLIDYIINLQYNEEVPNE